MSRRLAWLIGGGLVAWLLVLYPAYSLGGVQAVVDSAVALALCLVPTTLTLAWTGRLQTQSPTGTMMMVLGGTGIRMAFVLGVGLGLYLLVLGLQHSSFWGWVLGFYLFTLALEMLILNRTLAANGGNGPKQLRASGDGG